jgi:predicted RNA-binding Zn ribbon-like protein
MKDLLTVIADHRFAPRDFIAGDAALDFVNTVAGRDVAPRDRLDSYLRLLEWSAETDLLPGKRLRTLARQAQADPAAATRALTRAKAAREAMFAIVAAVVSENAPPKAALALLREHWLAGARAHEFRFSAGRLALELDGEDAGLDLIASMAAYRLVERVLRLPTDRLRMCQGEDCAWLFIDSSKAGRRRWCDMAVCGNKAKSRRFYARERRTT